jgi:hypothetical protein
MSAPARVGGPAAPRTRTKTPVPQRERGTGKPAAAPERTTGTRGRSAAADRAYARRAQRTDRTTSPAPSARPERKPGSAGRVSFVVLVMVLLVGGVVATLWFATQATADAYRLERSKAETGQLSVQVGQLQQQVAQQDSPPSLAQKAKQLGMVPAGDPAHLVVGPDGKVSMIGTPSAAQPPPPPVTTTPSTTTTPSGGTQTSQTQTSTTTAPPPAGG